MKLSGNKRKGRHLFRNAGKHLPEQAGDGAPEHTGRPSRKKKKPWGWKKRVVVILCSLVAAVVLLSAGVYGYYKIFVRQPVVTTEPWLNPELHESAGPDDQGQPWQVPFIFEPGSRPQGNAIRDPNKYTFLILANDDGNGNTDTIMVGTFDCLKHTFDIINIPRDTMVNVSWSIKKVNSILAYMQFRHRGEDDALEKAMNDTIDELAKIIGFRIDYWFVLDLRAFIKLVDEVGGVDFYVPVNMNYDDYDQNLHIHYQRGIQHLNGRQALEVVRFRNTYASGDIGRISVQQDFLTAAAQQILDKRSSLNVFDLADILINYVDTNMALNDLVWFGRQFLEMNADSITFVTMPGNYEDYVGPESYVTIYVDEWIEMVNNILNPFYDNVIFEDLSILTRGADRRLYVTDGNYAYNQSWGASSRGPNPDSTQGGSNAPAAPAVPPANPPDDSGEEGYLDPDDPGEAPPDGDPGLNAEDDWGEDNLDEPGEDPVPDERSAPEESAGQDDQEESQPEVIEPLDADPYSGPE